MVGKRAAPRVVNATVARATRELEAGERPDEPEKWLFAIAGEEAIAALHGREAAKAIAALHGREAATSNQPVAAKQTSALARAEAKARPPGGPARDLIALIPAPALAFARRGFARVRTAGVGGAIALLLLAGSVYGIAALVSGDDSDAPAPTTADAAGPPADQLPDSGGGPAPDFASRDTGDGRNGGRSAPESGQGNDARGSGGGSPTTFAGNDSPTTGSPGPGPGPGPSPAPSE
jgi:hypothetical protein